MAAKDDALAIVANFEASGKPGVWTGIPPKDVIDGLRVRINDPTQINQAGAGLCGPASFAFDLDTDQPDVYAKAVIDLYTGGRAVVGTLHLQPSKDLVFNHFSGGIQAADWIFLASLRDSSNFFFDVENVDDVLSVATIPSTIESWLKKEGYTKIKNETNILISKGSDNLREASRLLAAKYRVFLFVDSAVLYKDKQTNASPWPDHWIVLLSPAIITGPPFEPLQTVSLRVYTWGQERSIPEDAKIPLKLPDFLNHYYGYIAFKH